MKQAKMILGILFLMGGFSAYADNTTGTSSDNQAGGRPPHPEMTVAQKACFTDNGLTAPGEGAPPKDRPDHEVMHKVHECLEKNGMKHFGGPHGDHGDHKGPPPSDSGASAQSE
jgi:hypothetical protein